MINVSMSDQLGVWNLTLFHLGTAVLRDRDCWPVSSLLIVQGKNFCWSMNKRKGICFAQCCLKSSSCCHLKFLDEFEAES